MKNKLSSIFQKGFKRNCSPTSWIDTPEGKGSAFFLLFSLMAIFMVLFFTLNHIIPFIIDDYVYNRSFVGISNMTENTDPNRMVDSIGEFIASVQTHFMAIHDRFIVVILSQLFCIIDKCVFDVILTIMMFFMLLFISHEKGQELSIAKMGVALFLFLFVLSYPLTFYEGVTEPVNYVLPALLCAYLLYLLDKKEEKLKKGSKVTVFFLSLLAICTAWCHECISIPFAGAMSILLASSYRKLSTGERIIYLSFIIATAIMVFSPANLQRFLQNNSEVSNSEASISFIQYRIIIFRFLRITYLWAFLILCFFIKKRSEAMKYVIDNKLIILSVIMAIPFSFIVGGVNQRVVFGAEFFSVILIIRLLWRVKIFRNHSNSIAIACMVANILLISFIIKEEKPYIASLESVEKQVSNSTDSICIIKCEPQDTLPPQLQKYIAGTLNPFQIEQIRWRYSKKEVKVCPMI